MSRPTVGLQRQRRDNTRTMLKQLSHLLEDQRPPPSYLMFAVTHSPTTWLKHFSVATRPALSASRGALTIGWFYHNLTHLSSRIRDINQISKMTRNHKVNHVQSVNLPLSNLHLRLYRLAPGAGLICAFPCALSFFSLSSSCDLILGINL
ncbi:hypothetical protein VTO42DRAFT_5150 [Malbranchea cinnamomea]